MFELFKEYRTKSSVFLIECIYIQLATDLYSISTVMFFIIYIVFWQRKDAGQHLLLPSSSNKTTSLFNVRGNLAGRSWEEESNTPS